MDFILNFEDEDQLSQDRLFTHELPYYRSYQGYMSPKGLSACNVKTIIDSKGDYINEIRVENNTHDEDALSVPKDAANHLVMIHGYGASCGWFYKNLHGLICANPNSKIHALDLLGFGLSSRPAVTYKHDTDSEPDLEVEYDLKDIQQDASKGKKKRKTFATPKSFKVKSSDVLKYMKNQRELVSEVEQVYIDSLEKWRMNNGIERFDLMGHSFGGYMALAYALKYPSRVKRLVLVSPGGVERSPFAVENPRYLALQELAEEDDNDRLPEYLSYQTSHWPGDYSFLGRYTSVKESFKMVWRSRVSFFAMLRWMGPFGPKNLSERNIRKLTRSNTITDWKEIDLFMKYVYNTALKPSFSETSIMRIFDASIVAKYPLLDRLERLQVPKSLWIYGEHDFMFTDCGRAAVKALNSKPGFEAKFDTVSNAGHNLYLDNHKEFNSKVLKFLGWNEAK
ncbi:DEKNAAC104807 [Brettanomyces naardenensis]|uniref:DEKNAAC104807 n=1 Tax=Brettanomyces naardenensis TaxID=13370 RepID=A0A448YRV0_BRENA|nr:DEKNAAC104807 [Brettanomyces naardenensis]